MLCIWEEHMFLYSTTGNLCKEAKNNVCTYWQLVHKSIINQGGHNNSDIRTYY